MKYKITNAAIPQTTTIETEFEIPELISDSTYDFIKWDDGREIGTEWLKNSVIETLDHTDKDPP